MTKKHDSDLFDNGNANFEKKIFFQLADLLPNAKPLLVHARVEYYMAVYCLLPRSFDPSKPDSVSPGQGCDTALNEAESPVITWVQVLRSYL